MRRLWFALLSVLAVASITAVAAFGASVHFKGGATGGPFFNDGGLTLASSGAFSGLGNGDIVVELVAKGNPSATCGQFAW